jgi:hypothetical protein|tara:strand:+ start:2362 stop:3255 length:894 start_codon:yes stop_codon:yes gene_type:complete
MPNREQFLLGPKLRPGGFNPVQVFNKVRSIFSPERATILPGGRVFNRPGPLDTPFQNPPLQGALQTAPANRSAPQFPDPLRGVSFLPLEQVPRLEFVGSARDVKTEKKVFDALKPTLGINFKRFGVDLTFSKGISHRRFGLGEPTHKFDLYPQQKGVVKADVRDGTGLPSSSQFSVFFDPPFMVRKAATGGSREAKRFSAFDTREEAFEVWGAGVKEAARLLAPNGQFMVKIQDTKPSTGKNRSRMAATKFIVNTATESGMKLVDRVDKIDPDAFQPAGTAKRQARVSYLIFEKLGE